MQKSGKSGWNRSTSCLYGTLSGTRRKSDVYEENWKAEGERPMRVVLRPHLNSRG